MGRAAAAARVQTAPARPRPRPHPHPRPKASAGPAPRRRLAGGVVGIGAVSMLLVGVVALNVAVLRLNVRFENLGREQAGLRADNAELASEIAARAAPGRIQALARGRLGLVPAGPGDWTYLDLRR